MNDYYNERRQDRVADREQDRADALAAAEQKRKDALAAAELRRQDEAEREERSRRARREADREKARRSAERKTARAALYAKMRGEGDTGGALLVMFCGIIPALYFQLKALNGENLPGLISLCLAVMLEAGAWVATVAGERAKREGRPTGRFRLVMWACASFAAAVNFVHAPGPSGGWLAWVLAAASYAGVFFWEVRGWGRHKTKAGRTKAQRTEDRRRRRHDRKRRRKFPKVYKRYTAILAAAPYGSVDTETAWRSAWHDVHRAHLGITADVLAARVAADKALAAAVASAEMTPESVAVELFLADVFAPGTGPDDGPQDGPGGGPDGGPGDGPIGGPGGGRGTATALGRKRKQASGRTSSKTPDKPLAEADLDKVRDLADALRDVSKLSVGNVRAAVGGGTNAYLIRLRDAVKAERKSK
ncbi:hypothetical protein OVA19_00150 [Streptomyces sp. SL203]|nr:hypothetical protein [Streptomyces sp. SL203]MCY1649233.1 hypothetical protein [Streptomyces sp. SL203]